MRRTVFGLYIMDLPLFSFYSNLLLGVEVLFRGETRSDEVAYTAARLKLSYLQRTATSGGGRRLSRLLVHWPSFVQQFADRSIAMI